MFQVFLAASYRAQIDAEHDQLSQGRRYAVLNA
jgi:hypothetical protein